MSKPQAVSAGPPPRPPGLHPAPRALDTADALAAVSGRLQATSVDAVIAQLAAAIEASRGPGDPAAGSAPVEQSIARLNARLDALDKARVASRRLALRAAAIALGAEGAICIVLGLMHL